MNAKTLLLLTLCGPLAACDLFDTEEEMPSGGETGGEDSGEVDSGDEESSGEASSGEESSGEESSGGDVSTTDEPPSEIPAGLVDWWYAGTEGVHQETLNLFTDGTYQEERKGEVSEGTCVTAYTLQVSGEYTVVGDVLTLHATTSHLFLDECGTISESDNLPEDGVYAFELGEDMYGDTLLLTPQDGSTPILYHRLID